MNGGGDAGVLCASWLWAKGWSNQPEL